MPDARVVDLTHSIRQFDAVHAAFVLRVSMDSFLRAPSTLWLCNRWRPPTIPTA